LAETNVNVGSCRSTPVATNAHRGERTYTFVAAGGLGEEGGNRACAESERSSQGVAAVGGGSDEGPGPKDSDAFDGSHTRFQGE
jgi:hypothetical protein